MQNLNIEWPEHRQASYVSQSDIIELNESLKVSVFLVHFFLIFLSANFYLLNCSSP